MTEGKTDKAPARKRRRRPKAKAAGGPSAPLHKRSSSHFEPGDRQRGAAYHREGAVKLKIKGARALASVEGNEKSTYGVGVDWNLVADKRRLHVFCQCKRFSGGKPCKHLWATLLALAEAAPDSQPPGKDRVGLRKDRVASWQDLGLPEVETESRPVARARTRRRSTRRRGPGQTITWSDQLDTLRHDIEDEAAKKRGAEDGPDLDQVRFFINTKASQLAGTLVLDIFAPKSTPQRRGRRGRPNSDSGKATPKLQRSRLTTEQLEALLFSHGIADNEHPQIPQAIALVTGLAGEVRVTKGRARQPQQNTVPPTSMERFALPPSLYETVLPNLCSRGLVGWWDSRARTAKKWLTWDQRSSWEVVLRLEMTAGNVRLRGEFEKDGIALPLTAPLLVLPSDQVSKSATAGECPRILLLADSVGRLASTGPSDLRWIDFLLDAGEIVIPREELSDALTALLEMPGVPKIDAPQELQLSEERSPMQPKLTLEPDPTAIGPNPSLLAELSFLYGDSEVSGADAQASIIDWDERCFVRRDLEGEHAALLRLLDTEVQPLPSGKGHDLQLDSVGLPSVAEALLSDGWAVEVRGRSLRSPSPPALRVDSGIDWFELSGSADFEGDEIDFKKVLGAISKGDRFVELKDGSQGILPSAWVENFDYLASLAEGESEDGLRFLSSQALLVDTLLSAMPPSDIDAEFASLREKLRSFDKIQPKKELKSFKGTLRGYQRDGLGWLVFLRDFGLGGILADDMGLGKTVQVLALIQSRRTATKTTGQPFLVVAPRSLLYNWVDEAKRFTPNLKVVEYRGRGRESIRENMTDYDVIVTTYGTLRRDIDLLAAIEFDTVILDEAQAIKNRESQAAKASRVLRAKHRLALTGTPIENHLSELGSILEFLNPGLLGRSPKLDVLSGGRVPSREELRLVAEGVRPFILRRTKAQVLKDLPPKTEQVLYCSLEPAQRELYDQLRATYQASLLGEVDEKGASSSTMQVLEALLRLRQVACHPGLVNKEWEQAGSAKLELMFEQISEILEEGHKLIVFSQFTKLLAYVRAELDGSGTPYAYLDGKTRARADEVERFQTDPECNVFLISLKAGGVGLNLTAAGYVFLLDPWWNPAVEAQAIDRAHRIGQTQPVFAYRMIARDTVEEKILDLQRSKRKIADTILEGDGQTLGDLTADDLKTLLS